MAKHAEALSLTRAVCASLSPEGQRNAHAFKAS